MSHTDDLVQELADSKKFAYGIIQILNSDDDDLQKVIDAQSYCRQILNPPVIPAEPIEVEDG